MEFSRQKHWSRQSFPSSGDLPEPGIKPRSPTLKADSLPSEPPGKPYPLFSSVAQSCPTLCDPINCSTPGLPVHHQLPESTQTHVHCVGDAIQPSHPLSSPLPPSIFPSIRVFSNESASDGQSIGVLASASVLPMNTQDWSLGWTGWISLQSKGLSIVFSITTVQKHPFFSAQLSL